MDPWTLDQLDVGAAIAARLQPIHPETFPKIVAYMLSTTQAGDLRPKIKLSAQCRALVKSPDDTLCVHFANRKTGRDLRLRTATTTNCTAY